MRSSRTRDVASRDKRRMSWFKPASEARQRWQKLYVAAAIALAALVPLIFLSGIWMRSEFKKNQHEIERTLAGESQRLSDRLDGEVREQLAALAALAALPSLDAPSQETFATDVARVMASMTSWSMVGLVDIGTGRHVFSHGGDWPDGRDMPVIERVRSTGRPAVETRSGAGGGDAVTYLYAPVTREGTLKSVLVAAIDVPELRRISTDGASEPLLRTVVDANARILARSRSPERYVGQPASDGVLKDSAGRHGLFEATSTQGEPLLAAYTRSPLTGWASIVSRDREDLDSGARTSLVATIAASILSVLLTIILAVFLFHTVTERRLSNERLAASRALGDLDARLLATTQEALDEQRKAASEREVLLREIYHRVKNNLQIVQSLLRLGSRELKADQREPFESAVRRIGAMARVHTLLYNSPDLASIDFRDYLDELLRELSEGFGAEERSIEHVLDAQSLRLPLDTAVPLAFISVEILTNAFRHAFPEGRSGRISVNASRDGQTGILRIEDDGIGLTAEQSTKRRLGLTIVSKLVQQIGGTLETPQPGASAFTITFPLEPEDESAKSVERALDRHRDALAGS